MNAVASTNMTPLARIISEMIAQEGPISLERYMSLALAHPVHGYYRSKMPFGAQGAFITAPEISQMFGELIGLWAAEVFRAMGAPSRLLLIELGPGRGTLMADLLRAARAAPDFRAALEVHLVETSLPLRESQRLTLERRGLPLFWHERIEDLAEGPAIFIANEFFDALPVRHYVRGEKGWHERLVGLDKAGQFIFGLAGEPDESLGQAGRPGEILELNVVAQALMRQIAARIARFGGALLAIDYGYTQLAAGETLQAVKAHRFADPLKDPGEADLTAHVDFTSLADAAQAVGARVHGPLPQGEFLRRLGIFERAAILKRGAAEPQAEMIDSALKRLTGTGHDEMGTLFKAMAVTQTGFPVPPGFED